MAEPRLIILEPSKVGTQHITLLNSYLEAAVAASQGAVEFWCASSLWQQLDGHVRHNLRHRAIPVIDPSWRWFFVKVPLEVLVALTAILRKKPNDVMIITCLMSPALYLVALASRVLRPRAVYVVLHSELEAVLNASLSPKADGYGYWIRKFWRGCLGHRSPGLVVISSFIRTRMLEIAEGRLAPERVRVLTQPIRLPPDIQPQSGVGRTRPKVCFIGYRTRLKGFSTFSRMASSRNDFTWLAIGGGVVENMATGQVTKLERTEDFARAVSGCDIACFPYEAGYDISMSAAVLDAVSAGVHVIASRRGCFAALRDAFGEDIVQCADGIEEINAALNRWLATSHRPTRVDLVNRIAASSFSQAKLQGEMRDLLSENLVLGQEGSFGS